MMEGTEDDPGRQSFEQQSANREYQRYVFRDSSPVIVCFEGLGSLYRDCFKRMYLLAL